MIGVDWGTSSLRATRLVNGQITDTHASAAGIMAVAEGGFEATLRAAVGPWLAQGETCILMSGMIGSRQGWVEASYLPCPADAAALAHNLTPVPFDGATLHIVPGLSATDADGTPEVMRGEETQILGAGVEGLICLPGSHAKWVTVANGRILGFVTYLSGEAFSALRSATILGRMMTDAPHDPDAFGDGLRRAASPGHLLHHLFGVRTRGLMGTLSPDSAASYLSGLLIGHEVRAACPVDTKVTLLGAPALCDLYARAIRAIGGSATIGPPDAAARGLAIIGAAAGWT